MTLLALDLGTTTGWALGQRDERGVMHLSGTMSFKSGRYEGGGMRYLRFQRWLVEMIENHGVKEVVFEEVRRHLGTDAAHVYGGLLSQLTATCELKEVAYQGHPVSSIKFFAAGKGNAGKDAVIAAVKGWGYQPQDDNEADAIALLLMAMQERA